jgi:hypothetical protein
MKKSMKRITGVALSLLLVTAGFSMAMNHGGGHSGHGSQEMKTTSESGHGGGHMGMEMSSEMEMLGATTLDGVKAMAHISDTREAMAAAGMKQTHHLMVAFEDAATMAVIDSGRVAVRIVTPGGQTLPAISLQGMDGAFGGDVELSEKGIYTLQVGSQMHDNKARQFEFQYHVK